MIDAAVLESERARGVDAEHGDLVVDEYGFELVANEATVLFERAEAALPDAMERHVVVAGNDETRRRKAIEKGSCGLEFRGLGALAEVARDDHQIGPERRHRRQQGLDDGRVVRPKCRSERWTRVRNDDSTQRVTEDDGAGRMTFRLAGRMRYRSGGRIALISPSVATRNWRCRLSNFMATLSANPPARLRASVTTRRHWRQYANQSAASAA